MSDKLILKELEKVISSLGKGKSFILDGFPRTLKQALDLEKILPKIGKNINGAIYLKVPPKELLRRLSRRYICPKCGYISMSQEKLCPLCEASMIKRSDDSPDVASHRINLYLERTIPVVEFYRKKGMLIEINGDQKVYDVTKDILKVIKKDVD